jgi:hypothetical protein
LGSSGSLVVTALTRALRRTAVAASHVLVPRNRLHVHLHT